MSSRNKNNKPNLCFSTWRPLKIRGKLYNKKTKKKKKKKMKG